MKKAGDFFVQEFVIGLGLLSGMGIDINSEILKALDVSPFLRISVSIFIMILSLAGAFAMGKWVGLTAVTFAFIGGIFINTQFGAWMLIIGIILGFMSPSTKN